MDEAGCERRRHAVDDDAVTLAVAAGDQRRALGELVFPDLPVEHQLIHGGLPHLHRRRQFLQVDEPAAGIVREPGLRPADSRTPAPSGVQACFCRRCRYRVRRSAGCLPRYAFAPGAREPLPLDLAETRAKLAGTSRWNVHRDDRARAVVDYKIHWLKMMSVPESRAIVRRHDGINGRNTNPVIALSHPANLASLGTQTLGHL